MVIVLMWYNKVMWWSCDARCTERGDAREAVRRAKDAANQTRSLIAKLT